MEGVRVCSIHINYSGPHLVYEFRLAVALQRQHDRNANDGSLVLSFSGFDFRRRGAGGSVSQFSNAI